MTQRGIDTNALRPLSGSTSRSRSAAEKATLPRRASAGGTDAAAVGCATIVSTAPSRPAVYGHCDQPCQRAGALTALISSRAGSLDDIRRHRPAARARWADYRAVAHQSVTVVAAAAAAIGLAYVKGAEEPEPINKSLILTGNSAGVTALQLGDMAKRISAVSGTQSQAAAALCRDGMAARDRTQN